MHLFLIITASVIYVLGFLFFLIVACAGGGATTPFWEVLLWPIAMVIDLLWLRSGNK